MRHAFLALFLGGAAVVSAGAQVSVIRPGPVQAIGPKQDDPLVCPGSPGGVEAIGPKQDDPRTADAGAGAGRAGIIVQGGRRPVVAVGGVEAIGPKQDDPRSPGSMARPGDDNDPRARTGVVSIGPKQDDPRARVAVTLRPGDDNDPRARAIAGKCGSAKSSR